MQFFVFTRSWNIVSKYLVKLIRAMCFKTENLIQYLKRKSQKSSLVFMRFLCQVELKFANFGS